MYQIVGPKVETRYNTFPSGSTNSHSIPRLEQLRFSNCMMHLSLKNIEKTFFAYLLTGLWSLEHSLSVMAKSTELRRHDGKEQVINTILAITIVGAKKNKAKSRRTTNAPLAFIPPLPSHLFNHGS